MLHNLSRQIKIIIKIFFLEIYTNLKHTCTLNYLIKKKETIARYELHVHQNIKSWSYMYIKICNPGVTCTSKYAILELHVHQNMQSWSYMYIKIFNPGVTCTSKYSILELHVHQNMQSWSHMYITICNPGVTCISKYSILCV